MENNQSSEKKPPYWERVFAGYTFDRGLISRMQRTPKTKGQGNNDPCKLTRGLNIKFTTEGKKVAKK